MVKMERRDFLKGMLSMLAVTSVSGIAGCGQKESTFSAPYSQGPYDYLIISADKLYEKSCELAEHRSKNHNVDILRTSDIMNYPSAESLRDFLRDYAMSNPELKHVVLIGNPKDIPTFKIKMEDEDIPSDFPYSNIKEDKDVPDTAVGRLPCDEEKDLETIINKIKENEPLGINKVLSFGHGPELEIYGKEHNKFLEEQGYNADLAEDTGQLSVDFENTLEDVNKGIDAGIYYGHASAMAMYPFAENRLDKLSGKPFVLLSGGCDTLDFTNDHESRCIGYAFLKEKHGSLATIGATRHGGYGYKYSFVEGFFSDGSKTLGEKFVNGLKHCHEKAEEAGIDEKDSFVKRAVLLGDPGMILE